MVIPATLFNRMVDAGMLDDFDRVDVRDGVIVEKMPKDPQHVICQAKVSRVLHRVVPAGWHVAGESPMDLNATSVPYPDLMVLRGEPDDYRVNPGPADAGQVVEVASTSPGRDLGRRRIAFAAGVPIYWVVDLTHDEVVVHARPAGAGEAATYRQVDRHGRDDVIPLVLDGVEVARLAVADLLPGGRPTEPKCCGAAT